MTEQQNSMFDDNDLFAGLDDVETWDRLPWFEAGHRYLLEITDVKVTNSQKEYGVRFYVMEFNILESSCPDLPAGTRASHRIKCTRDVETRSYGPMNFKQFLSGVSGIPANTKGVFEELGKGAVNEGLLNGQKVWLQTSLNKTGKFTNHTYSQYKGD
jgi:hypothetical protein